MVNQIKRVMKELSIEEKAKAYDDALDKIKMLLGTGSNCSREELEYVFPELKESEDEITRKALINLVEMYYGSCIDKSEKNRLLAWIEKQGENNMGISESTKQKLEDNLNKALEKETPESCNEFLEKQGEHKSDDKVEPKFKVGDWCIDNEDGTIFQIVKVLDNTYTYKTNEGKEYSCTHYSLENDAKVWTIQDAKDGDVLVASDGSIFLLKDIIDNACGHYVALTTDDIVEFNEGLEYFWEDSESAHPATKGQRDLLFQKMYEAGYEWDAEKKELKKIEQNFSEYEKPLLENFKKAVYDCAWEKVTCKVEGESKEEYADRWAEQLLILVRDWADDYIDSREDAIRRRSFDKAKQSMEKPSWTEEDERMMRYVLSSFDPNISDSNFKNIRIWFESLKNRVQPQPKQELSEEDERITEIKTFIAQCNGFNKANREKAFKMLDTLRPQNSITDEELAQPKQEWSEEDELMLEGALDKISDLGTGEMIKDWLKSLKGRIKQL